MNKSYILIASLLFVIACNKDTVDTSGNTNSSCNCDRIDIDRFQFMNWDGSLDTATIEIYQSKNNYSAPTGGFSGLHINSKGYHEGFPFYLSGNYTIQYKIKLKHHQQVYTIKSYSVNADTAPCNSLNDSMRCFNSYQYIQNDSLITVPKKIVNYNIKHADTLYLY